MLHASSSEQVLRKDTTVLRILLPSILSILVCLACLIASSWAWFTDSATVSVDDIVAGEWEEAEDKDSLSLAQSDTEVVIIQNDVGLEGSSNDELIPPVDGTASGSSETESSNEEITEEALKEE